MPNQANNILFNFFSLLSIFYSTFSLFSQICLSPTRVLSLFLLQIKFPHPHWSPHPYRSSCCHCLWSEDSIAADLKPPSSSVWSRHCHLGLKLPCHLDLNASQPRLKAAAPLVWYASQPRRRSKARWSKAKSSSTALVTDGWLNLVIDWSIGLGFCWRFWFFFSLFCWGFWIWNLLECPVIVVVICGSGCFSGCCCGGGCSNGCWFLVGGDCHWAVCLYIVGFWVNRLFNVIYNVYIILMFRIKE